VEAEIVAAVAAGIVAEVPAVAEAQEAAAIVGLVAAVEIVAIARTVVSD
jgi:hypothetical protein